MAAEKRSPGEQLYSVWAEAPVETRYHGSWENLTRESMGRWEHLADMVGTALDFTKFLGPLLLLRGLQDAVKAGEGFRDTLKAVKGDTGPITHEGAIRGEAIGSHGGKGRLYVDVTDAVHGGKNTQWINPDSTIIVEAWWHEGVQYMTVATRDRVGDSWGPPVQLVKPL